MLECTGRFLGFDESSRTSKDGRTFWTRTIEVRTRKGTEALALSEDAYALLKGVIASLTPFETELIAAVEASIGREFVNGEAVPRVVLNVLDLQALSSAANPVAAAAANGQK